MSLFRSLTVASAALSILLLASCGGTGNSSTGSGGSGGSGGGSAPTITAVGVTPASASLNINATQQLQANATYSDRSTSNVTASATWTSSNATVATVSSGGLVTAMSAGTASIKAADGGQTATAAITVNAPQRVLKSIAITPNGGTISAGNTLQLKATGTYNDGSTSNLTSSAAWSSSTPAAATVSGAGLVTAVAAGTSTITATSGSVSANVQVAVSNPPPPPTSNVNITTYHFDNKRTGLNNNETILTPSNVNTNSFGKLFSLTVDGYVYAQPLYMSGVSVNGTQHNVVLVSTEKDQVYAFDADNYNSNTPLWHTSLLQSGESPTSGGNPSPYHGSTSTPVIDASTGTMYVVSQQTNGSNSNFRLSAIDISTGSILNTATLSGQISPAQNSDSVNGVLTLPQGELQRAALLLDNGRIYIGFSADDSGWLLAYDEATLTQKGVFASGPNNDGNGTYKGDGGIWMGGGGPIGDGAGNVYVTTGNGPYNNATQAYGDSIVHFDSSLNVLDWFTPQNYQFMQCQDQDLSGGGVLMLPNGNLVAGGKSGEIFQVDSGNLGQGPHTNDTGAITTLYPGPMIGAPYSWTCSSYDTTNPPNGQPYPNATWNGTKTPYQLFATGAYYNNSVFVGMTPGPVVQMTLNSSGQLTLSSNYTQEQVAASSYGATPVISANNNNSAVLWFIDHGTPLQSGTATNAILRAYDPNHLGTELYDSSKSSADTAGYGVKFSAPIVANGKVYIATGNDANLSNTSLGEIDVYGLK
jgi:uncharacterized protein YjdB